MLISLLTAASVGIFISILGPSNAALQFRLGTWGAATIIHLIGLTVALLGLVLLGPEQPILGIRLLPGTRALGWAALVVSSAVAVWVVTRGLQIGVPWYGFLGGVLGMLVVIGTIFTIQRMGVVAAMTCILGSQLVGAALVDGFGLCGQPQSPMSVPRLVGLLVVAAGAALTIRSS